MLFCAGDLNLNLMTLIYEFEDIHGSQKEISGLRLSKVTASTQQTDRQTETDRRDRTHYHAAFVSGNNSCQQPVQHTM